MEAKVREVYAEFDKKRKAYDAQQADFEELKELETLSEQLKKRGQ